MCAIDVRNIRGEVTEVIDQCTVLVDESEQVRENREAVKYDLI